MKKLLLFSASKYLDTKYLEHTKPFMNEFFKNSKNIILIPFASVIKSYDELETNVKNALSELNITSLHHYEDYKDAIKQADAILVSGGNTFTLLNCLYQFDLVQTICEKVLAGTPYAGWSAGSNIAGRSIMTTNDMPIVYPPTFDALNLVDLQINPHFIDKTIANHNGESREQRLAEFLKINPDSKVIALYEGAALSVIDEKLKIIGLSDALIFSSTKHGEKIVKELEFRSEDV